MRYVISTTEGRLALAVWVGLWLITFALTTLVARFRATLGDHRTGVVDGSVRATGRVPAVVPLLRVRLTTPRAFLIGRENFFFRLMRTLGQADDLRVGDPDVDERWHIAGGSAPEFTRMVRGPAVRDALRAILVDLSPDRLGAEGHRLELQLPLRSAADWEGGGRQEAEARLLALRAALDASWAPSGEGMWRYLLVSNANIALLVAGVGAAITHGASDVWTVEPTDLALHAGLAASVAALAAVRLALADTGWLGFGLFTFALFGFPGMMLGVPAALRSANADFDTAPATETRVGVAASWCAVRCYPELLGWTPREIPIERCDDTRDASSLLAVRHVRCGAALSLTPTARLSGLPGEPGSLVITGQPELRAGEPATVDLRAGALGLRWFAADSVR